MRARPEVIAIDGPAASGKSTVGKAVADRLGYLYFDTGAMYRAVTWQALASGVPVADEAQVTALAEAAEIDVLPVVQEDGRQYTVLVDGQDVTWAIREPAVAGNVSQVSAYPGVRAAMVAQQRRLASRGRMVMVGRDIGTVVLPDAPLKIYLDASAEERAQRRWLEEQARGRARPYEAVLAEVRRRDQIELDARGGPAAAGQRRRHRGQHGPDHRAGGGAGDGVGRGSALTCCAWHCWGGTNES